MDDQLIESCRYFDLVVNIVEELIENSINAEATKISIEIDARSTGLDYLAIKDDGHGIFKKDCMKLSHELCEASKLLKFDSYNCQRGSLYILSLLLCKDFASMKIITKTNTELFGRLMKIFNGEIKRDTCHEVFSTTSGTTIEFQKQVKKPFYLASCKRSCLRLSSSNMQQIRLLIAKYAIIFNHIRYSFKVINNKIKPKYLVIPARLSITQVLSQVLTSFASGKELFTSIDARHQIQGNTIHFSGNFQYNGTHSFKFKLLSINKKCVNNNSKNPIFHKINAVVNKVSKNLKHGIFNNWVILIEGIPNNFFDAGNSSRYCSKFDDIVEKDLLQMISKIVLQAVFLSGTPDITDHKLTFEGNRKQSKQRSQILPTRLATRRFRAQLSVVQRTPRDSSETSIASTPSNLFSNCDDTLNDAWSVYVDDEMNDETTHISEKGIGPSTVFNTAYRSQRGNSQELRKCKDSSESTANTGYCFMNHNSKKPLQKPSWIEKSKKCIQLESAVNDNHKNTAQKIHQLQSILQVSTLSSYIKSYVDNATVDKSAPTV